MVLGLSTVRMLALGFTLVGSMRGAKGLSFDYGDFWRRTLIAASGARLIALHTRTADPGEAFVAGMLSNVGVLAVQGAIPRAYGPVVVASEGDRRLLAELERAQWDIDHAAIAAALSASSGLPAVFVSAVGHYLNPAGCEEEFRAQVRSVGLARLIAEAALEQHPGQALREYLEQGTAWCGLNARDADAPFLEVQADASKTRDLFELPDWSDGSPDDLRWRAHATLSVLMIDLDHFKTINDSHRHAQGDEVVRALAGALRKAVRPRDAVARYGGDEFVVILPGSVARAATFVAERLRRAVSKLDIREPDGSRATVSASIGVAEYHPPAHAGPEALLADADRALYEAKRAGRNRVVLADTDYATSAA